MKILYHLTRKENVPSILQLGLIPEYKHGQGVSVRKEMRLPGTENKTWLTDDPKYIIRTQLTQEMFNQKNFVVLKINVSGIKVENIYPHEWLCGITIKPDRIELGW